MTEQQILTAADEVAASTDRRSGFLSGPGFTDVPVVYSVVDGIALFNGCIDMGPVEQVERAAVEIGTRLAADAARAQDSSTTAPDDIPEMAGIGLPADSTFLWPNGVVPFVIDAGLSNQQRVTDAINHFTANTGIRFVARTTHANYIRFVSNGDAIFSSSPIGMRGGEQLIRISNGASAGTVIHESCHSLGILHEQSRCDRDSFVEIKYANITAGFESNFDKFCAGFVDYFDYDFASIMHYPTGAFSKNGQDTIVARVAGVTLGQRKELSFGDRLTIAEMYSRFTGKGHSGVWRSGSGGYALWVNATWDDFLAKWNEWGRQGLRLVDLNVRGTGSATRYSGVWLPGTGGYGLWANANWASFLAKWNEWNAQGLRLVDMHVQKVGNEYRYSGVWRPGTGGYGLWVNASWESFVAKWNEWNAQGLRLVDINVLRDGDNTRYSGVWLPGTGGYGLWANASWTSFAAKWTQWSSQGLRLVDVNAHRSGNDTRWSGVFLPGSDGYALWGDVSWEGFRAKWQQLAGQGLRLVDYEFTEPHTTAADLDAAGLPVVTATVDAGSGGGAVTGDGSPTDVAALEAPAEDGYGALVLDTSTVGASDDAPSTVPASVDGLGGLVLAEGAPDADAEADADAEGQGRIVHFGVSTPTNGEVQGVGELVLR